MKRKKTVKFTFEQEQEVLKFYLTPESLDETCKHFKCSKNKIYNILKKYSIQKHDYKTYRQIAAKKYKQNNLEKYGVSCTLWTDENIIKKQQTWQEKYGVDNPLKSEYIKYKSALAKEEKYGCKGFNNQEKRTQTCLKKYGVANNSQTCEYHKKAHKKYYYNYNYFDSFPELVFYLYHIKNNIIIDRNPIKLEYIYNNKIHWYFPDFSVAGQLYEIKEDQFLKEDGTWQNPFDHSLDNLFEAKHQCAITNQVIILYNKDYQVYLDWFYTQGYKKDTFLIKSA